MAYIHQPYPKWKYHGTSEPRIVNSEAEEKVLGEDWFDNSTLTGGPGRAVRTIDEVDILKSKLAATSAAAAVPIPAQETPKPLGVLQEMAKSNEAELQEAPQGKEQEAPSVSGGVDFDAMTKRQLIDHAANVHGLQLDANSKRGEVIAAITAAQSK